MLSYSSLRLQPQTLRPASSLSSLWLESFAEEEEVKPIYLWRVEETDLAGMNERIGLVEVIGYGGSNGEVRDISDAEKQER